MKKSLTRKLLLAVITLGIAVIATVGSTYAWFSMNTTVEATGMQLTAVTPVNVVISKDDTTYGPAVEFESSVRELYPVSTVNGNINSNGSFTFYAVKEGQVIGSNGEGGLSSTTTEFQSSAITAETVANHNYVIAEDIYLKTTGGKVALTLSEIQLGNTELLDPVTSDGIPSSANAGTNKLADAIYVALCTKNGVFIYQAGNQEAVSGVSEVVTSDGKYVHGSLEAYSFSTVNVTPIFDTVTNPNTDAPAGLELGTTGEKVTVLVWLEGEDPDCLNAIGGLGLSIGLKFAYVESSYEAE
ncbi:hypothetical protein J6Y73_01590 [bacterium]|nr:hypothetical protein [bacterium]